MQLRLSLALRLESHEIPDVVRPVGPLFHRWVPDGDKDALCLTADDEPHRLCVWFERRAVNVHGYLEWRKDGEQFDVSVMERQHKLDGGTLRGEVYFDGVTHAEMDAVTARPIRLDEKFGQPAVDSPEYVGLAKRVVAFVQPRLSRFIETLRSQYGQYWLRELLPWDSRKESIGAYCTGLGLCWWDEAGAERFRFLPTDLLSMFEVPRRIGRGDAEYLTQDDWQRLQKDRCLLDPPLEVHLLGQATQYMDNGQFRQAYVEAVTALELAISRLLQAGAETPQLRKALQSATDKASLKSQAAMVMRASGIEAQIVECVLQAIDVRNRVVHEGYRFTGDDLGPIRVLIRETAKLLGLDEVKMPVLYAGNGLSPPDVSPG